MTDEEKSAPEGRDVRAEESGRLDAVRTGVEGSAGSPDPDAVADGGAAAAPDGRRGRKRGRTPWWKELPVLIGVALVLALLIKTFLVQAFSIPSGSMENTLQKDDRVLVDKLTPWFGATPERGQVVVFRDPGGWLPEQPPQEANALQAGVRKALAFVGLMPSVDEKDLIKRVIAVGGDTVECNSGEPVKVNGTPLDEPYIHPGATPCDNEPVGTVKVPADHLWVMGDHRNDSLDSRAHATSLAAGSCPWRT